jgi:hypothetical protein
MVVYTLYAKADLEGIDSLSLNPESNICISVRNPISREEVRERIVIDPTELHDAEIPEHEKHRSEHPYHFVMKWDGDKKRSTIRIVNNNDDDDDDEKMKQTSVKSSDKGTFVPILQLDCDGLEPYAFHPLGEEFSITIQDGVKKDAVDLSGGEWNDYDISYGSSSIKNFQTKFE